MLNKVLCKVKTEKDKKAVKELIELSRPLLRLIEQCCKDDYNKYDKISDEDFKNPNWAIEQAYKLGLKKGLTMLSEYVIIDNAKD